MDESIIEYIDPDEQNNSMTCMRPTTIRHLISRLRHVIVDVSKTLYWTFWTCQREMAFTVFLHYRPGGPIETKPFTVFPIKGRRGKSLPTFLTEQRSSGRSSNPDWKIFRALTGADVFTQWFHGQFR